MVSKRFNQLCGASLLVAGTCVGAGALALPLGLLPFGSLGMLIVLLVTWLVMFCSGLFVYEANLSFPSGTNLTSMTETLFGGSFKVIVVLMFLGLLYSLLSAYMTGGASLSHDYFVSQAHQGTGLYSGAPIWAFLGVLMLTMGVVWLDYINRFFMVLLVASYFVFVTISVPHIHIKNMVAIPYHHGIHALSIVMTAFGFQVIVPSLRSYVGEKSRDMVLAIGLGTVIPLLVYLLWCVVVYGVIPYRGAHGLLELSRLSNASLHLTSFMSSYTKNSLLLKMVDLFLFAAIASSFIGIALSLSHFLKDLLSQYKIHSNRLILAVLTLIPPLVFALIYPGGFALALRFAGVFVACLNLLLPAAMVYKLRYGKTEGISQGLYRFVGGKFFIFIVVVYGLFVIFLNFY